MKRLAFCSLIPLLGMPLSTANAQESEAGLESTFTLQAGDYAAVLLPEFLRIRRDLTDPVVVTYEPEPNRIDVEIIGGRKGVERARAEIGQYWAFIEAVFLPYVERRLGMVLDENDFSITFYDASRGDMASPVVQMVDGQFLIP